jgi:MtrB/PioB family decaheme-associated outer membrane protein
MTRHLLLCLLLATAPARTALAQAQPASQPAAPASAAPVGEIDFGVRVVGGTDDLGRYYQFRDPRTGPTLNRLRHQRDRDAWTFSAAIDQPGYRDQRYSATFERFGRYQASFEFNQVPLLFGEVARTPFTDERGGRFRLNQGIRAGIQGGAGTIASFAGEIRGFELRSRRDVADMRFQYSATRELDLTLVLRSTARTGAQPWGATFGFNNATEFAAPLDHRTNDLTTSAEWSNRRGMVRLAYDGSWFNNDVETLVWDNPLRATDRTYSNAYVAGDGSSQGRMALWPDSTAHTVSASGSVALPARSRAFAYVSVGSWLQDAELLPHTINSAIAPIALDRQTAEAEARIVSMNYRLTSRPAPTVWLTGQFRLYDYDNRTPHFTVGQYVRVDGVPFTSVTGGSEPFGYTRQFVDLDASFTPLRYAALRVGYGREHDDRTFRFFEKTTEHTVRASVDSTGLAWGSLRVQYDHAVRTGEGLDEQVLSDIGEQVSLRQFDISDRTRDRVTATVQFLPVDSIGLTGSLALGREERPDVAFGLQDNDFHAITVGVDLTATESLLAGLSYGFENYSTLQRSRQANPGVQFNDPTRDWSTDMDEDVHTVTASLDLPRVTSRAALSFGYDYVRSNARYLYVLPANSSLTPPQQLPPVRNRMQRATADLRYTLARQLALGVGYWLDAYDVEDFAMSPGTLNSPLLPAFLNVGYQLRPYDVHTGFVRLIYQW